MYITGQSVSSINLLQMATRTRNMDQLSYFSSVRSNSSLYESYKDCEAKLCEKYVVNKLGFSFENIEAFITHKDMFIDIEDMHCKLYVRNSYALDLHQTNILYFFEEEIKLCGFNILDSVGKYCQMDKSLKVEMNEQSQQVKDEKFELLIESFNGCVEDIQNSIKPMIDRCQMLNLKHGEDIEEYRDIIEDQHKLEHFWNYNRLNKSYQCCENSIQHIVNTKMTSGLETHSWFKIKYVHMLAQICSIDEDLFAID
jgi:hypothetical protein